MMFKEAEFGLAWSDDLSCQLLELPYINDDLSMLIIVPKSPGGSFGPPTVGNLDLLESRLNAESLTGLLSEASKTNVRVYLPKFKVEYSTYLKDTLVKLGIGEIFEKDVADLSGMDGSRQLYLSKAIHKAFIEVNEEGTEAAAATGMIFQINCMPLVFRACQPFLYVIRDNRSGTILFMGRIIRPSTE